MRKTSVLVCGSGFGKIYLNAISKMEDFYISGILGSGSKRTKMLADELEVPYFEDANDDRIIADLACVIIPNSGAGGRGFEVAKSLLKRGISVLLEHPAHEREILECLKVSKDTGFMINPFYRYTEPFLDFLDILNDLKKQSNIVNMSLECSINVLYDGIDMLSCCLNSISSWKLGDVSDLCNLDTKDKICDTVLVSEIGNTPVTFKINRNVDKYDADHPMHLYHRIETTFSNGRLCLINTNGPIIWLPFIELPRDSNNLLSFDSNNEALKIPTATVIGSSVAPSILNTFEEIWINAVKRAIVELNNQDRDSKLSNVQSQIFVSRLWSDICKKIGYTNQVEYHKVGDTKKIHENIMKKYQK